MFSATALGALIVEAVEERIDELERRMLREGGDGQVRIQIVIR
jgi:hypothetical protein